MICVPATHARRQVRYWYSRGWHSPRICLILIKQYLHYPLKLVWNPCYYTKCNIFPLLNKLFLFYKHLLLVFISWARLAVNTPLRRGHYEWGINVCPRHLKHTNSIFSLYWIDGSECLFNPEPYVCFSILFILPREKSLLWMSFCDNITCFLHFTT